MRREGIRIVGVCGVLLCVAALAMADDAVTTAAGTASTETSLTTEGLLHSAMNLYHTPDAVARAGRLVAISDYLASIAPKDPRVEHLLADVYQSQGKLTEAAAAARALLEAHPDDFAAGTRWLRFTLSTYNRAGERCEFLAGVLKDTNYSAPLRSVAAVELARIYVGQGAKDEAVKTLQQALQLDPLNNTALLSSLELQENPTAVDRARTMLALMQGNPRAYWVAQELAGLLCDQGLYELGLQYYRQAWALWGGNLPVSDAPVSFATEYLSALLDANNASAAVSLFEPAVERLKSSTDFSSLMIEAYTKAGQDDKAEPLRQAVEDEYRKQMLSTRVSEGIENATVNAAESAPSVNKTSANLSVNMAWYYLLVANDAEKAYKSITEATELGAKGEAVDLCTGAAQLAMNQPAGLTLLTPLVDKYPLASAFLARYELEDGQSAQGTKTLLAGIKKGRRNLAYRMLAALAKKYDIEIPPVKDAQAVADLVSQFDPRIYEMGTQPEKFIRITVKPDKDTTSLCEPITVTATLENISQMPVSVDTWGLLSQRLGMELRLGNGGKMTFASMPMLTWPSPRYLAPGKSVSTTGRLDVGQIAKFLANHPLLPVELSVAPIVSPQEAIVGEKQESQVISGLPPMKLDDLLIRQNGLLASPAGTAEEYNQTLASLRQTLAQGDLAARVLAARRIAAILAWIRDVENGKATVPEAIRPVMNKKYVLGLMGMALQDKVDVVRAEMITALQYADMGASILNQVGMVVEDPSPLVRFRMAELLGASDTKGNRKLIEMYAKDADPRVRTMARAFLFAWQNAKPEEKAKQ